MFVVCFYCTPSGWCPAVCGQPGQSGRGDGRQPKRPCRKREAGAWNPQGRISAVAEPSRYKKKPDGFPKPSGVYDLPVLPCL